MDGPNALQNAYFQTLDGLMQVCRAALPYMYTRVAY